MRTLAPLLALALLVAGCGGDGAGSGATSGLRVSTEGWKTDFARHSVPLGEISSGGPPRDGIPPIDEPRFVGVEQADFLDDREPVLVVEQDGRARAYPLQILVWHEIVNDDFAGTPLAVTYCPLCNSALVFDRRLDGRALTFEAAGDGRFRDRQTASTWDITGRAVEGELRGRRLEPVIHDQQFWFAVAAFLPAAEIAHP